MPGGNVKRGLSRSVRAPDRRVPDRWPTSSARWSRTVDGRPVRVGDVADVIDGYQDVRYLAEVNGVPSITVGIQKQSGANTVEVAAPPARRGRAHQRRARRPAPDRRSPTRASSSGSRSTTCEQSALWGSLLALVILYLFLRSRASTAIIGVSIPISVIACFALLYFGGLTLNQMTFGGLALGVGMMVDNAIVVLENIVRKREETGCTPEEAAAVGAVGGGRGDAGLDAHHLRGVPARWCSCSRSAGRCSSRWPWWSSSARSARWWWASRWCRCWRRACCASRRRRRRPQPRRTARVAAS